MHALETMIWTRKTGTHLVGPTGGWNLRFARLEVAEAVTPHPPNPMAWLWEVCVDVVACGLPLWLWLEFCELPHVLS